MKACHFYNPRDVGVVLSFFDVTIDLWFLKGRFSAKSPNATSSQLEPSLSPCGSGGTNK
jgi:hypothetical protein